MASGALQLGVLAASILVKPSLHRSLPLIERCLLSALQSACRWWAHSLEDHDRALRIGAASVQLITLAQCLALFCYLREELWSGGTKFLTLLRTSPACVPFFMAIDAFVTNLQCAASRASHVFDAAWRGALARHPRTTPHRSLAFVFSQAHHGVALLVADGHVAPPRRRLCPLPSRLCRRGAAH